MSLNKKIIQPYIKHDENASQDGKILKLCHDFKKLAQEMTREELESFISHGAYAIFWRILEYLHGNKLSVDDVEIISDNLRIDTKFINKILNDYELFRISNGEYVSDRLLRDLELQQAKGKKATESANSRWLLSTFNKYYTEFFEDEPILEPEEIETLKKYDKKIPNFKTKLRDILYTLKYIKFDKTVPRANWLLKENNLGRILNGEFGELKHKPTEKELKQEEEQLKTQEEEHNKPSELEEKISKIESRDEALNFILEYYKDKEISVIRGKAYLLPPLRILTEKFSIPDEEIIVENERRNGWRI